MKIQGVRLQGTKLIPSGAAAVESDTYFNLVTLLLPGTGTNGAQNNTFLDSSTNNFTVTRNGNTTQGTFSPFSQTGWSNYLATSSERLTTSTSNSAFSFGTGDFTVEGFVNLNTTSSACMVFQMSTASTGYSGSFSNTVAFYVGEGAKAGKLEIYVNNTQYVSTNVVFTSADVGQWRHFAIVRSSGTTKVYWNGSEVTGFTAISDSANYSMTYCVIGTVYTNSYSLNGYLSNFRVVKGTALYSGSTITVPSSALTAVTNTSFLIAQSNRFIDNSTNAIGLTVAGSPSVQSFSPFNPTTAYSAGTVGGSGYFDGSGDYLSITSGLTNQFDPGSAFTFEGWFYINDTTDEVPFYVSGSTIDWNASTGVLYQFYLFSGTIYWQFNGGGSPVSISGTAPAKGQWCHVAVGYNGTTTRLWVNGASIGTSTSAYTVPTYTAVSIGAQRNGGAAYNGFASNIRFVKGTDVYGAGNTSITVPTAPLTAISNTSLLLNYTNGGITDVTAKNVLETVGGADISTAQSKFGGSSMAFDGDGDFLIAQNNPALQLGSDNFTIDGWFNLSAHVYQNWSICSKGSEWALFGDANRWVFQVNAAVNPFVIAWTPVYNIWYHFACVRNGSTTTMYINGNSIGSGTSANITNSTGVLRVGRYGTDATYDINGYIQDLRITKGYARYTANFTAPTQAFPTQ